MQIRYHKDHNRVKLQYVAIAVLQGLAQAYAVFLSSRLVLMLSFLDGKGK